MNDDGGFNDAVTRVVDHHVTHGELGPGSLLLSFTVRDTQALRVLSQRVIHVFSDVSRELNRFPQAVNALDDSADETGREFARVG